MSVGELFVGVDVGTSAVRAAAYLPGAGAGTAVSVETIGYGEFAPLRAQDYWTAFVRVMRSLAKAVGPDRIRAVGVAGMAESGTVTDSDGEALGPVLPWHDRRGVRQAALLRSALDPGVLQSVGIPMTSVRSVTKARWMLDKAANPTVRTAAGLGWTGVPELMVWRATGNRATDHTLAVRTGAFDPVRGAYLSEVLDAAGLTAGFFPPVLPPGSEAHPLTRSRAAELGLRADATMMVAGHDDVIAAVGFGLADLDPPLVADSGAGGWLLDSAGTAEALVQLVTRRPLLAEVVAAGLAVARYPLGGWAVVGGAGTTGALLAAISASIGLPAERLELVAADSGGYPERTLRSRVSAAGLPVFETRGDDPGEIWSAALDDVARRFGTVSRTLARVCGSPRMVGFTGGGARSAELVRRKLSWQPGAGGRLLPDDLVTAGAAGLAERACR